MVCVRETQQPEDEMTTETDLMAVDHSAQVRRAYHDLDGVDWRHDVPDDRGVINALRPDAKRAQKRGSRRGLTAQRGGS